MVSSILWHAASTHTLLLTERAEERLLCVDRDFGAAQNVNTLDLNVAAVAARSGTLPSYS